MCNFGYNAPKRYCYKYNIQDITTECQVILRYDAPFCTSRFAVTLSKHRILVILRATHSMSLRAKIRGPRGILCTRGEKAHTNKRVSVIACDNAISKVQCAPHRPEGAPFHKTHARYFCTCVEKKAQTSKRVSIIACNNVISKAQLSGTPRDTMYPWGKGANKQKGEHYCLQ